ncbi:MAG TPA: hypothetical protein VMZ31_03200 [Phycisphaerae bacterium]|nr:hypothetical protein [Phycisphaerae bacterium]
MPRIKVDGHLYDRARKIAEAAGYTNVDEFIVHVIEREVSHLESAGSDEEVQEHLRGLGYIE